MKVEKAELKEAFDVNLLYTWQTFKEMIERGPKSGPFANETLVYKILTESQMPAAHIALFMSTAGYLKGLSDAFGWPLTNPVPKDPIDWDPRDE